MTVKLVSVAKTLAAVAVIGAVVTGCSSAGDSEAGKGDAGNNPGTTASAPETAAAAETPPVGAPASPEDQAEIIAITKTYITGLNNGDAKMIEHAMCAATLAQYGDLSVGARPSPTPQQLDGISEISVAGDSAFGMVEYTLVNDPAQPTAPMPFAFKNEGGWKVCTEP